MPGGVYSEFTLPELVRRFGLTVERHLDLFGAVPPVPVDVVLQTLIDRHLPIGLATNTEKSRAELLIAPVVVEVLRLTGNRAGYYSVTELLTAAQRRSNFLTP